MFISVILNNGRRYIGDLAFDLVQFYVKTKQTKLMGFTKQTTLLEIFLKYFQKYKKKF